jgi:hypothetical protein
MIVQILVVMTAMRIDLVVIAIGRRGEGFDWGVTHQQLGYDYACISTSMIKHDIQYFERVGYFQNNIGHLDT